MAFALCGAVWSLGPVHTNLLNENVKVQGPAGTQRSARCHLGGALSQLVG